jgi:hypothetical protein
VYLELAEHRCSHMHQQGNIVQRTVATKYRCYSTGHPTVDRRPLTVGPYKDDDGTHSDDYFLLSGTQGKSNTSAGPVSNAASVQRGLRSIHTHDDAIPHSMILRTHGEKQTKMRLRGCIMPRLKQARIPRGHFHSKHICL